MDQVKPKLDDLATEERRKVESLLIDFDQRWQPEALEGRVQDIPTDSSLRLPLLVEMVKIDLEKQWAAGNRISLEEYLGIYPELGNPGDVSADLILAEYEVRKQFGAGAALEDYLARFPHKAADLARMIAAGTSSRFRRSPDGTLQPASDPGLPRAEAEELSLRESQQFGRYVISRRLGRGGMGSVYLARDTHLDRDVALKIPLLRDGDAPEVRERFLREARTAARLDHPYLCQVYDYGEHQGRLFLTMAYIEGKPLSDRLTENGMPPRHVAALVGKLALALEHAHEKGVVHRDLKPANIMIKKTARGHEPVIVDFGLARGIDPGDIRMTKSGHIVGTVAYMAPEQVRGEHDAIGPSCDIYALGVILYELLTGQLPFQGSMMVVAAQIMTQAPLPPSSIRPEIPPQLEAICLRALSKAPADRQASMGELAAEIFAFLKNFAAPGQSGGFPVASEGERTGENTLVGQLLGGLVSDGTGPSAKESKPGAPPESSPATEQPGRRRRTLALGLVGVCLIPALAMGVIFRLKTSEGVIRLENVPEGAEIFVEGESISFKREASGQPIQIRAVPGRRKIEVKKDGFKTFGEVVNFSPDKATEVTVSLEPMAVVASKSDASKSDSQPDRSAAQTPEHNREVSFIKGEWKIEGNTLIQSSLGRGNDYYPRVIFGDSSWSEYDFSFEAKKVRGEEGIVAYVHTLPGMRVEFGLGKYDNKYADLSYTYNNRWGRWPDRLRHGKAETGRWYRFRIEVRGTTYRCYVDDALMLEATDRRFSEGRVGLATWGTEVHFREIRVVGLDGKVLFSGFPNIPEQTDENLPKLSNGEPSPSLPQRPEPTPADIRGLDPDPLASDPRPVAQTTTGAQIPTGNSMVPATDPVGPLPIAAEGGDPTERFWPALTSQETKSWQIGHREATEIDKKGLRIRADRGENFLLTRSNYPTASMTIALSVGPGAHGHLVLRGVRGPNGWRGTTVNFSERNGDVRLHEIGRDGQERPVLPDFTGRSGVFFVLRLRDMEDGQIRLEVGNKELKPKLPVERQINRSTPGAVGIVVNSGEVLIRHIEIE